MGERGRVWGSGKRCRKKKTGGGLHFTAQLATPRAKSQSEGGKTGERPSETTFSSSLPFLSLPLHNADRKLYQMSLQEWKPPSDCDEEFEKFWKIFIEVDQTFSALEVEVNVVRPK